MNMKFLSHDKRSNEPKFLAETSSLVHKSLPEKSLWVLQGWLFHHTPDFWKPDQIKAFLQGAPIGNILVLGNALKICVRIGQSDLTILLYSSFSKS